MIFGSFCRTYDILMPRGFVFSGNLASRVVLVTEPETNYPRHIDTTSRFTANKTLEAIEKEIKEFEEELDERLDEEKILKRCGVCHLYCSVLSSF